MMNRFEKKCFIGSAGFHGLLLVVFIFGSAFITSKKTVDIGPVVTMLNATATDRLINSGGNPNASPNQTPPPPIVKQAEPPPVEPPKAAKPPEPDPEPIRKPEPKPEAQRKPEPKIKDIPKKDVVKDKGEIPVKPSTKDNTAKTSAINTNVIRRSTVDVARLQKEANERAAKDRAERAAWERRNAQLNQIARDAGKAVGDLSKNLGKSVVVDAGAGPGGLAFANYGGLVGAHYKRAVDATHPQSDENVDAVIRVVVLRDGTVQDSQWVRRTGNSVLDKAVDRAMKSVRSVPPFPAETKDTERTFTITLAFEAKRVSA